MSKSGGTLKHSTGRAKIRHMNMVVDFQADLADHQATYTPAAPVICACGSEVETQPMQAGVCYDCYRARMTYKNVTINFTPEQAEQAAEIEAIAEWTEDDHVYR